MVDLFISCSINRKERSRMRKVMDRETSSHPTYSREASCLPVATFYVETCFKFVCESWSKNIESIYFNRHLFQLGGNKK